MCPNCEKTKEILTNQGYHFAIKDMEDNFADLLLRGGSIQTAPVIDIDGTLHTFEQFKERFC